MARKLRLEFPGACYHVINRGNYRADVFATEGAKVAFEKCLFEACEKFGWALHAFVIMRNHYHLAVATPGGDLSAGMQWLQATFANRFNRLRGEQGHLFQGRYKALVVEAESALGPVCHYIHLNPVRAKVVPLARLDEYRHSSYWYLKHPPARPEFLKLGTALADAGVAAETTAGRRRYAAYLAWQAAAGPAGSGAAYVSLSRGWALGTAQFKTALVRTHEMAAEARAWGGAGAREIREQQWEDRLQACLRRVHRSLESARTAPKSAGWKVAIAAELKARTPASNRWLAERLHMGSPVAVSQYVSRLRRAAGTAKKWT